MKVKVFGSQKSREQLHIKRGNPRNYSPKKLIKSTDWKSLVSDRRQVSTNSSHRGFFKDFKDWDNGVKSTATPEYPLSSSFTASTI